MNRSVLKTVLPWVAMGLAICACAFVVWLQVSKLMRKRARACPVVCIDPGHPSETNSARTVQNGTTELKMNWEMAGKLADALRSKGIETVLTRKSRDEFVRNHTRAAIANDCQADLSLHLHCDAGPGRGYTIYYPNKQGTLEGRTGPPPRIIESSRHAAYLLHGGMASKLRGWLHDRGVRGDDRTKIGRATGTLTVSAFSEVPTVTVEMCFLSNRRDADFIKSQGGQAMMARALANGVVGYLLANGYSNKSGKLVPKRPGEGNPAALGQ